tara:strand:+ start:291 stop:509 length:219 start_codon:yes stop_codon:yes gene_type:complete
MDQNPSAPIFPSDIAHGNKKAISKSKIINKIATDKNERRIPFLSRRMLQNHTHRLIVSLDQGCLERLKNLQI